MLRYSINVTLDGCCDHEAGLPPDQESMRFWTTRMEEADAVLYGRVTYEMMRSAWRRPSSDVWPEWMQDWEVPFAEAIDEIHKHVISTTLTSVDWNAELVRGELKDAVEDLKRRVPGVISLGGVALPRVLADLDLIDEYEFVVHPVVAGHGPRLLDGVHAQLELELMERQEFRSGVTALRFRPRRA